MSPSAFRKDQGLRSLYSSTDDGSDTSPTDPPSSASMCCWTTGSSSKRAAFQKLGFESPASSTESFLKVTTTPVFGVSLSWNYLAACWAKRTSRTGFILEIDELYLTIIEYLLVWECGQQILLNDQVWATFTSAKGCIPDMIWSTRYNPKAFKANKYTYPKTVHLPKYDQICVFIACFYHLSAS